MKKVVSLILSFLLLLGTVPLSAFAANSEEEALGEVNIYNGNYELAYLSINGTVRTQDYITVFLKPMSYYSLLRIKVDQEKCISCGKCKRVCPMDVDVTDNSRQRCNGTECILCMECVENCPTKAVRL